MFSRLLVVSLLLGPIAKAGVPNPSITASPAPPPIDASGPEVDWWTGEGVSAGGILFPHFHAQGTFGGTTAGNLERLAGGHHDPSSTRTLQALEPGLSLRAGDILHGFATYSAYTDGEERLDGEWEEAFLKLPTLPLGFELRGGRFLNRFGFQNAAHSHSWDFVNQNLLNSRLLQEGEVLSDGIELTWNLPTPFRSAISFSWGEAPPHDDSHDHDDDHHEDDHGDDDHGDDDGHHDDDHALGHLFEGEEARFADDFLGVHGVAHWDYNDFHRHRFTLSAVWGENAYGRTTEVYGLGYEYLWSQNGYEGGGRELRWRSELAWRRFGVEDEDESDRLDEFGLYSQLTHTWNDHLTAGLRAGWVSGVDEAGLDERWRLSPSLTLSINPQRTLYTRVQYDYDHSDDFGSEHSIFLQFGFNWGGPEVR